MNKKSFFVILSVFFAFSVSAQLMQTPGYKNTLWSGFGNAWDSVPKQNVNQALDPAYCGYLGNDDDIRWTGLTDTFQARLEAGSLLLDVMLKWGALSSYNSSDNLDALEFKYLDSDVNFVYKATKNFDLGMGTYLNWKLGPAPSHGGNSWETSYHLKQGGLSYGVPSQGLVAGALYYANYINTSIDLTSFSSNQILEEETSSLAARYTLDDVLQLAAAIPSGSDTDDFIANIGGVFTPANTVLIAASYNGIFRGDSNFYAGMTFGVDAISIDAWIAMNNIGGKKDNRITGIGGAINFSVEAWRLRPEAGFTLYENKDYSMAMYAGMEASYNFSENVLLGLWGSFAFGSDDSSGSTKTGGKIFNLRPDVTYYINSTDALTASYEYQMITTCQKNDYNFWNIGFYWTHVF